MGNNPWRRGTLYRWKLCYTLTRGAVCTTAEHGRGIKSHRATHYAPTVDTNSKIVFFFFFPFGVLFGFIFLFFPLLSLRFYNTDRLFFREADFAG